MGGAFLFEGKFTLFSPFSLHIRDLHVTLGLFT